MATMERLENEELVVKSSRSQMPSRAKYYYNEENEVSEPAFKGSRQRFSAIKDNNETVASRFSGLNIENEELKRDIFAGNPNILPSGATLEMLRNGQAPAKPFNDDSAVSFKLNTKGKLLFSLYAVLVLSLILVIILNAIAIEKQKSENLLMSNEIATISQNVSDLQLQSENLSHSTTIQTQALNLGMQQIETVHINLKVPNAANKPAATVTTNWFDWFCDIFS